MSITERHKKPLVQVHHKKLSHTERAIFFTSMQPTIINAFLGITDSRQFRKTLAEYRGRWRKEAKRQGASKKDSSLTKIRNRRGSPSPHHQQPLPPSPGRRGRA